MYTKFLVVAKRHSYIHRRLILTILFNKTTFLIASSRKVCLNIYKSIFSPSFRVGIISRYPKPQPQTWTNNPRTGTGLLPGDRPAEGPRHPL